MYVQKGVLKSGASNECFHKLVPSKNKLIKLPPYRVGDCMEASGESLMA